MSAEVGRDLVSMGCIVDDMLTLILKSATRFWQISENGGMVGGQWNEGGGARRRGELRSAVWGILGGRAADELTDQNPVNVNN